MDSLGAQATCLRQRKLLFYISSAGINVAVLIPFNSIAGEDTGKRISFDRWYYDQEFSISSPLSLVSAVPIYRDSSL